MIWQWLASPEWANIVKALLHTLWQGAVIVVLLGLALHRLRAPVLRYRCSLAALAGLLLAGLVTWAVLNRPVAPPVSNSTSPAPTAAATAPPELKSDPATVVVVHFPPPKPATVKLDWTAWLALVWLAGAAMMLVRAGCQVAGAERLRRSSKPLNDTRLAALMAEARRAVGLARRVRLAATDRLTSPAVVGVLVPTLILPLSLTTSLTLEQLRFILLHELAHIRRGDYFANLFQLFAEALLFFNPAAWWISRQIRIEREACCDALAIQLSGAPAGYAQTLVRVAENVLQPAPAAALTLANRREPSSLADRVQRLLVPGYRPHLRLTWRAMITALLAGGALLFVLALGTRVTIAAILPPQERIERIEKKMAEYGVNPAAVDNPANPGNPDDAPKVKVSGHIRMADGSPVPKMVVMRVYSSRPRNSEISGIVARNGQFSYATPAGTIYIGAEITNFAPTVIGPLDGWNTNRFENLEIVVGPGFDVPLQVVDADSGATLPAGTLGTLFWMSNQGFQAHTFNSGSNGSLTLTHCADLPLDVTVNVPGYEILQKHFEHLHAGETLRVGLRRGETVSGTVLDGTTGQPLAGAEFHLLYQSGGENPGRFNWDDSLHALGQSGPDGAFNLDQLRPGLNYYLGVTVPGHESVILKKIIPGTKDLVVKLGPELIVQGRVNGNLDSLQIFNHHRELFLTTGEMYENVSYQDSPEVPLRVTNGVATFQFTNRTAGRVTLSGGSYRETRDLTVPIDDWVVNLDAPSPTAAKILPAREVIFRFKHPPGVVLRGTVEVTVPDSLVINHLTAHSQEIEITNGEVHVPIAIGGQTEIEPKHMAGYWFNRWTVGDNGQMSITVPAGPGPLVINIPLIPAGAIYAQARNSDGTTAGGLMFGVGELKRAPGLNQSVLLGGDSDSFSDNAPRKWVSGPLPLGGTYAIHGSRGNSFCVSQPIKLTDASPDAEVELQFPPGQTFHGTVLDAGGKPLANAELKASFVLSENNSFGLASVFTDDLGRFELDNTTPNVGVYSVEAEAPGIMAENVKLKFGARPQTIRLKRGHMLGGRLVQAGTGYAIPDADVLVWVSDGSLPTQRMHTDAGGRFEFTNLGDGSYSFLSGDGQLVSDQKYRADGNTNLTLKIKLYDGSKAKPKAPIGQTVTPPGQATNAGPAARSEVRAAFPKSEWPSQYSGTVYYLSGKSAAGVLVAFYPGHYPGMGHYIEAKTDANGQYKITVEDEELQVWGEFILTNSIMARDFEKNLAAVREFHVNQTNVDLVLKPAITLSGSVKNTEGQPIAGAGLNVLVDASGHMSSLTPQPVETDASGQFTIPTVPPGCDYQISGINAKGYGSGYAWLPAKDAQTNYDFPALVLQRADRTIAGQAVDENGQPLAGVSVSFSGAGQPDNLQTNTDSEGRFAFGAVCAGPAKIFATYSDPHDHGISRNLNGGSGIAVQAGDAIIVLKLNTPMAAGGKDPMLTTAGRVFAPSPFTNTKSTNLLTRTFPVDPNTFDHDRDNAAQFAYVKRAKRFFTAIGLNLTNPPGKAVTLDESLDYLSVTATESDLDVIERAFQALSQVPDTSAGMTTATGLLSNTNFQVALRALNQRTGTDHLSEPEVTTTSLRNENRGEIFPAQSASVDPSAPRPPQVLIEGQFYRLPANAINEMMAKLPVQVVDASSWSASAETLDKLIMEFRQSGFTPIQRPRIQTSSGIPAQFYIGNGTNWTGLACTPVVTNGQVNLTVSGTVAETLPGGAVTNRFRSVASLPNLGGLLVRAETPGSRGLSNVVMLLDVQILNSSTREALLSKLKQIRLANVSFDAVPLSQVLQQLAAEAKKQDPERRGVNMLINPGSPRVAPATFDPLIGFPNAAFEPDTNDISKALVTIRPALHDVSLEDALDAILLNTNLPIKYSVQDFAVVFSAKGPEVPQFFMRTFRMNTNVFLVNLRRQAGLPDSAASSALFQKLFNDAGVNLQSPPGKSVFYNYGLGVLFVKATEPDLDQIEKSIAELNNTNSPPQSIMTFRLNYPKPEAEVKKQLLDAGVNIPPTHYFYNPNGDLLVRGTPEQLARVNRVVLKLNGYSPSEIESNQPGFMQHFGSTSGSTTESTNLFMRTFRMDPNTLYHGLRSAQGEANTNGPPATPTDLARDFFATLGVNLNAPAGKAIFYNDRTGIIIVTATDPDLDIIERALQVLNEAPLQVHIKVRFWEVPKGLLDLNPFLVSSNAANGQFTGILGNASFKTVLRKLSSTTGVTVLGEPEITVLSGRQTQARATEFVATNWPFEMTRTAQTNTEEVGPKLDVTPYVLADGYTINLPLIPSDTVFGGYDQLQWPPHVTGNLNVVQLVLTNITVRWPETTVNLWDNQTVVLGGLNTSTVNSLKNLMPGVGDWPIGRLFQSQSIDNLMIFVTATIIDPAGNRVHSDDDNQTPSTQDQILPQPPNSQSSIPAPAPAVGVVQVDSQSNNLSGSAEAASTTVAVPAETPPQSIMTVRLNYPKSQAEVKKQLLDAGVNIPPTLFFYNANGVILVRGTPDQLARVNRVVLKLDGDSPSEIESNLTLFNQSASTTPVTTTDATNLFTRTFRVEPYDLENGSWDGISFAFGGLYRRPTPAENLITKAFFTALGVNPNDPPGKSAFYFDNRQDLISVKATESDLDTIERALQVRNELPPQIHVKARFYEVPKGTLEKFGNYLTLTNSDGGPLGILNSQNEKQVRQTLQSAKDSMVLGQPEITVISGRRLQMRATEIQTIVTSLEFANTLQYEAGTLVKYGHSMTNTDGTLVKDAILPQTRTLQTGPILDAIAYVQSDGNTINLQTVASQVKFLGYTQPPKNMAQHWLTNSAGAPIGIPVYWPTAESAHASANANLFDGQTLVWRLDSQEQVRFGTPDPKREALVAKRIQDEQKKTGNKEVIVLVTATIVDPAGNRVHSEDQTPAQDQIPTQPPPNSQSSLPAPAPAVRVVQDYSGPTNLSGPTNIALQGRAQILAKLDHIRLPTFSTGDAGMPLADIVRQLNEDIKKNDPEKTGVNISIITNAFAGRWEDINSSLIKISSLRDVRMADLLDAIVLVADMPIKYSIQDNGVVFSANSTASQPLFMRTFRIDPNTFNNNLWPTNGESNAYGSSTNPSQAAREFFSKLGVNLDSPPGKSIFFNKRLGILFVKSTEADLDTIERALQVLNEVPLQVHLKARFIEVDQTNNMPDLTSFTGILTDPNFQVALHALSQRTGGMTLGEPK